MNKVPYEFGFTICKNVITSRDAEEEYFRADKLRKYIEYREARELLRKHKLFTKDIKEKGLEVLK